MFEVNMKYSEYSKEIRKGKLIHFCSWIPEGKLSASMVLIHGLGEHCRRYGTHFADFYTNHNIGITSFDLPGHGLSYGKRGHIDDPNYLLEIIDGLLDECRGNFPGLPLFLYGHSLGGEIGLWYNLARKPKLSGVIITSPVIWMKEPLSPLKMFFAKIMDKVFPSFTMDNDINPQDLSKDKMVVTQYVEDPLVHSMVSARTGMVIINRGQWILENAAENSNDLLLMVGDKENIVSIEAIEIFSHTAPRVTYKLWPGYFHELHNELEKQEVFNYTLDWMKKHIN